MLNVKIFLAFAFKVAIFVRFGHKVMIFLAFAFTALLVEHVTDTIFITATSGNKMMTNTVMCAVCPLLPFIVCN